MDSIKLKFIVVDDGDRSVGIWPLQEEVTIELSKWCTDIKNNPEGLETFEKDMCILLANNFTDGGLCYTEKEWDDICRVEAEAHEGED